MAQESLTMGVVVSASMRSPDATSEFVPMRILMLLLASLVLVATSCTSSGSEDTTSTTEGLFGFDASQSQVGEAGEPPGMRSPQIETWQEFWESGEVESLGKMQPAAGVADEMRALVATMKQGSVRSSSVMGESDGGLVIDDCLRFEAVDGRWTQVWVRATVTSSGSGLADFSVVEQSGCVPSEVAEEVFAAYAEYWERRAEYLDPPDPESSAIAETTTGQQSELLVALAADLAERGAILRGVPTVYPEVVRFEDPEEIVVLDCQLQDPARGVYNGETGVRHDDIQEIVRGQRDLRQVTLLYGDGRWRVADVQAQVGARCEHAPSWRGLPVV